MIAIETKNEIHRRTLLGAASQLERMEELNLKRYVIGGGYIHPLKDRRKLAIRILDALEGPRLLWRLRSGMYALRCEEQKPLKEAELLGLLDLGATLDDVLEMIE